LEQFLPIISDTIIESFRDGSVMSVAQVKEIVGEYLVELCDGTRVEVDRIILCTGYRPDFSFLGELDPTTSESDKWFASKGTNSRSPPRLYQNTFSLGHPESLAFVGTAQSTQPAFLSYDLASMAIAQIWKGNSHLPSKSEMIEAVNAHHEYVRGLAIRGSVYPFIVKPCPWMQWVNGTAGTGMNDYLGYGVQGWKYWFFNGRVCGVLMTGPLSPHIYRLFDGKRKVWKGARAAIMELYIE
jgi:dimethylaniline monooxygenase (N-oxide forming)